MLPQQPNANIVWLPQEGPGGGGGGGGNQMKEPPKQAEEVGKDKITVPVKKPPKLEQPEQPPKVEPNPVQQLNVPAMSMAAATQSLPGDDRRTAGSADAFARIGQRRRSGNRRGNGHRAGNRFRSWPTARAAEPAVARIRPGSGVTNPRVLHEVKPQYTSDAMRAKIQGTVLLECIVRPDGSVGDVQVLRSLDPTFGLDQEAIKAAKQWRFSPGMHLGEAVPVIVTIELQFTLR